MVFVLLARLKFKSASDIAKFLPIFEPLRLHSTTNEPQTLSYELVRTEACDRTVVVVERYESSEALDTTHLGSDAFKAFFTALVALDILDGEPQMERLDSNLLEAH